jgi:hypothetical protein
VKQSVSLLLVVGVMHDDLARFKVTQLNQQNCIEENHRSSENPLISSLMKTPQYYEIFFRNKRIFGHRHDLIGLGHIPKRSCPSGFACDRQCQGKLMSTKMSYGKQRIVIIDLHPKQQDTDLESHGPLGNSYIGGP